MKWKPTESKRKMRFLLLSRSGAKRVCVYNTYLFVWRLRIDEDEETNDESDGDSDCETEDPQHTPEKPHPFSFLSMIFFF